MDLDVFKELYMKIGLIVGSFSPLHNGSLTLCKVAETLSEKLIVIVINAPDDQISVQLRTKWLKLEIPSAIVTHLSRSKTSPIKNKIEEVFANLSIELESNNIHLFSSNPSMSNIARILKFKCTILDPEKLAQDIHSKDILANPYLRWFDMPISVRLSLIKRVVLIGPESVGKSTLAKQLKASLMPHPFLPEYGRPYEVFRNSGPYKDNEFEDIIEIHAKHREALLPFSGPVFIEDTDELATAVWVEMLMNKQLLSIEKKIKLPFLYLLLNPSVPFVPEETRYFNNEKRVQFFNRIKDKLDFYNASYIIIKGPWSTREAHCKRIIKNLLTKTTNWSELS